ncbi:hypothetical protein ACQ3G6_07080 [Allorhizobium undicola]|uniref:hypothetical protein n=1 Tax=Allorhizobium undicola TaxID=78527 RepID=UPI003D34AC92
MAPIIYEFSDYGGKNSTMRAKITPQSVKSWCGSWHPNDVNCAATHIVDDTVHEARADCETGDLWTEGKHYRFDGPETENHLFEGYLGVKDVETGKRVGMSNAERGREFGTMWLTLCPMGWPYKDVAPGPRFETPERYGEIMGHNGSLMFFHQKQHIIVYSEPKPSIAGSIKPETVLFRGWSVANEWISGIAYTFKQGCDPAPYFVSGNDNGSLQLRLSGKAPVREGCKVVGYTDKSPNATLVFDRGE